MLRSLPFLVGSLLLIVPIVWAVTRSVLPEAAPWTALLAGMWLVREIWPSRQAVDSWHIGARGEAKVAHMLAKLDNRFCVLHDRRIPGRRANIDHLVIGPTGVFIIETKNVRGKIAVRGSELFIKGRNRTGYVQQAWREAIAVQEVLAERLAKASLDVRPLICFVGDADLPWGTSKIDGVSLAYPRAILKHLKGSAEVLTPEQVREFTSVCDGRLPAA